MPSRAIKHIHTGTGGGAPTGPPPGGGARLTPGGAETGRSARKRQAIMEAATTLFLRDGYRNTSMDQVAADAAVSKQTVYKQFADKEQLFRA
ncbi:MAG TPA: helix-turn-helix domain-containing protein, partial [Polyangia bacterium]